MKKLLALIVALVLFCSCACAEIVEIVGLVESAAADDAAAPEEELCGAPTVPAETAAPTPEPSLSPESTALPRLHGLVIGIDPGHQEHANRDLERVGPDSNEKKAKVSSGTQGVSTRVPEYVTNLEIALQLRDALEALGCTVHMTRETHDVDISNYERAIMMNKLDADLVLRLHCDGSDDSSAHGIGMFVRKTGIMQEESEAAAYALLEAMSAATGARARGVFLRDTYTMNNWSIVPCILVEMGYMSNPEEDEKLNDPAYQLLLVEGMVEGICSYFER